MTLEEEVINKIINNYKNNETTVISYKEYELLRENLKEYKKIKELKPIAKMMEREIDRLIVWM